jgi:Kef-type K+ transport system membrane component KefB
MGVQLLLQAGFMIATWVIVRWLAPMLMRLASHLLVPFGRELTGLGLCLLMAGVAEVVGLSAALGAFFAGIAVSQTKVRGDVARAVDAIGTGIFVPVFFVSIGLHLHLGAQTNWLFVAALTVLAVVSKWLGAGLGAKLTGSSTVQASVIGAGMISRGEMALIVALMGERAGLLPGSEYDVIIAAIILATIIAPFILRWQVQVERRKANG